MSGLVVYALAALGVSAGLALARLLLGPTAQDRVMASDVLVTHVVAALAMLAILFRDAVFIDGVLVVTLVGFVGTVAYAQLVQRG